MPKKIDVTEAVFKEDEITEQPSVEVEMATQENDEITEPAAPTSTRETAAAKRSEKKAAKTKPKPERKTKKSKVDITAPEAQPKKKTPKKKKPELTEDEKLIKSIKPKQFIADGSSVFRYDVEDKYREELENTTPLQRELFGAMQKDDAIITAKIVGTRRNSDFGPCAICTYGDDSELYQIIIPFDRFTELDDTALTKIKVDKERFLDRRIDTIIDVCIDDYIKTGDTYVFIGNRVKAMKVLRLKYWHAVNLKGAKKYLQFNVGSLIDARVVGIYPKAGIGIEVYGVETLIPLREISWRRVRQDLSTLKIKRGDIVTIRITSLHRNEENPLDVRIQASIKKAMPDPRMVAFDMMSVGDIMSGTVALISGSKDAPEESRIYIALENGGEAICERLDGETVRVGDRVSVYVSLKKLTQKGEPLVKVYINHVEARE